MVMSKNLDYWTNVLSDHNRLLFIQCQMKQIKNNHNFQRKMHIHVVANLL